MKTYRAVVARNETGCSWSVSRGTGEKYSPWKNIM